MELIEYLANFNGEFNASLGESGGYITFSNSGRRGNIKYFQISLDSLKKTIEDILDNISIFENIQDYVEKNWRDNGSSYFSDEVANAMITVQTKPLFSTLSKLIKWGNEPTLDSVDDTSKMIITQVALENTLQKLKNTIQQYTPKTVKLQYGSFGSNGLPLQTIFYGAPGTGKSYKVKSEKLAGVPEENIFRTTFHPDYDYASFVGCYKPTKEDDKITYSFIPQVFTKAYVKAWEEMKLETPRPVCLVIEEINRGNCAQIFGDIFQLLDRNESGYSEYPIDIDEDLKNYLVQNLGADSEGIKNGKHCLPPNLNILATMNTSDQSLFPMDSAFKRRWDWEYVAITNAEKNWQIKIDENDKLIDWWTFLQSINMVIADLTSSEDKQLGYFFTKPDEFVEKDETKRAADAQRDLISAKRFVSKVIFYLWNDVFKNNSFEHDCCKDDAGKEVLYAKFYAENGKDINLDVLRRFFMKLKDGNGNPLL